MSKSTRDQFNDVLRKQGLEVGIKPVLDVPNEESRLAEVERLGILKKDFSGFTISTLNSSLIKQQLP